MQPVNVAVVGATGAVGEAMIEILEARDFPVDTLYPLASSRSAGRTVQFRGKRHSILDLAEFDFSQTPIALFSAGGDVSAEYAPAAAAAGCVVIDNTSHFRRDDDIPLVVAEVNPEASRRRFMVRAAWLLMLAASISARMVDVVLFMVL